MPVTIRCPNPTCGAKSTVDDAAVDRPHRCPQCNKSIALKRSTVDSAAAATATSIPRAAPLSADKISRYEIRGRLGAGAFGTVFRAYDPQLDREVALKVPHSAVLDSPKRIERFLREAKAAANLRHPHIVPVFDTGTDDGQYYIASAFINGQKLADAVEASGGGLEFDRAARLVRELAEALAYAHEQGIVHRDVKPDNVMLDAQDRVHLMDFGLAFRQDEGSKLTNDGAIMGTPSYMSPEQAKGDTAAVGPAADQYAVGVVLYELLTGRTPFSGPIPVVIHNHIHTDPDPPSRLRRDTPKDLETVCLKAISKRPEDRYPDCQSLSADLRRWQEGEPISARRMSVSEWLTRWANKNKMVAGLTAGLAVALVLGAAASLWFAAAASAQATRAGLAADEANDERQKANEEKKRADDERQKAEQSADLARSETRRADERAAAEVEQATKATTAAREAERQAKLADARADEVRAERDERRKQLVLTEKALYSSEIGVAYSAWRAGRMDQARMALSSAPAAHRGWEYAYLRASFDGVNTRISEDCLVTSGKGNVTAVSRDGLVALITRKGLLLWDPATQAVQHELKAAPGAGALSHVTFRPDGQRVAAVCDPGPEKKIRFQVWETGSGKSVSMVDVGSVFNTSSSNMFLVYSPDGSRIAVAADQDGVLVVNAATGAVQKTLKRQGDTWNSAVMFSANGSKLLAAGGGNVREWDLATGAVRVVASYLPMIGSTTFGEAVFGSDGKTLLDGETIRILDGKKPPVNVNLRLDEGSWATRAAVSPDGKLAAVGSNNATVYVFRTPSGDFVRKFRGDTGPISSLAFTADGRGLVSSGGQTAHLWALDPRPEFVIDAKAKGHAPKAVALSRDGAVVAVVGDKSSDKGLGSQCVVWDAAAGTHLRTLAVPGQLLNTVAVSADGKLVATFGPFRAPTGGMSRDGLVRVWEVGGGKEVSSFPTPWAKVGQSINQLAFSPDGKHVAMSADHCTRVWEVRGGPAVFKVENAWNEEWDENARTDALAFHPSAPRLLRYQAKRATIEDLTGGRAKSLMRDHRAWGPGRALAYSPDAKWFAIGTYIGGGLHLVDASTSAEERSFVGHTGPLVGTDFTPDGGRLVSGSEDGTVRVWDTETGRNLLRFEDHVGAVIGIGVGGDCVASLGVDGKIRLRRAARGN